MFAGLPLRRFAGLAPGLHYTFCPRRGLIPYEQTVKQTKILIAQDTRRVQWPMLIEQTVPEVIRKGLVKPYLLFS